VLIELVDAERNTPGRRFVHEELGRRRNDAEVQRDEEAIRRLSPEQYRVQPLNLAEDSVMPGKLSKMMVSLMDT
jgi:hypothetical protein